MIHPELLAKGFESNTWVIHQEVADLTHEESLIQPPYHGNCLNWVLGHIIENRNRVLVLVNLPRVWDEETGAKYKSGSKPITGSDQALRFENLLECLDHSSVQIGKGICKLSMSDMEVMLPNEERTLGQRLLGLYWHEAYHIGQTDILRQVAGKNDDIF